MNDPRHFATLVLVQDTESLRSVRTRIEAGVSKMLRGLDEMSGLNSVSIIRFSSQIETDELFEVPSAVRLMMRGSGAPAFCDSVWTALRRFEEAVGELPEHARPRAVQVIAISDGQDSASLKYSREELSIYVREQRDRLGWDHCLIGLGPEASMLAEETSFTFMNPSPSTDSLRQPADTSH